MPRENLSHAIGFDDAPFPRAHRGRVLVIGAVYAGLRLEGVLRTEVQRDGDDAAHAVAEAVRGSRFGAHTKLVLFQGIAFAGFNVIDIHGLHEALGLPVLVVARRAPDLPAIREALLTRVPGGAAKWQLVERAGVMEPLGAVFVQRAGLSLEAAAGALGRA